MAPRLNGHCPEDKRIINLQLQTNHDILKYIKSQSVDNLRTKVFYEIKNITYLADACFSKQIFALINVAQIAV